MNLNIPWIKSRRKFLIAIAIDVILNVLIYSYFYLKTFNSYPNFVVPISISAYWIISSYIFGRYMKTKKINLKGIFKYFLKTTFIFLFCNFIYLSLNWSHKFFSILFTNKNQLIDIKQSQNIFFLKTTFLIFFISFCLQYLLSIFTYKFYSPKKYWLFYGSDKDLINLKKEINIFQVKTDLQIINAVKNINEILFEDVEGIIVGNNVEMNQTDIDQIFNFKSKGFNIIDEINWCENKLNRIPPNMINSKFKIIEKFNAIDDSYNIRIKRIGDFIVSLFLLLITLPINIIIALLIYIEDQGPIFYSQVRTGYRGEKIKIYKFRSMVVDAEKSGPQWAQNEDKRITKIGKIIRSTRLDELPQLLSVLEGTMSLIGPRPERPEIEFEFLEEIPFYKYRTILKPGISGWAQVNYPYGNSIDDTIQKLSYDIYYINHISFLLDLFILFKTIKTVFNAKGYKSKFYP